MVETIWCTACECYVDARLTSGKEIYPHRPDLADIPMWRCDACHNYVGTHWKSKEPLKPLGVIADRDIMNARRHIHALLDPMWKTGRIRRGRAYKYISKHLGYSYHTGEIRTIEEARKVW